MTNKVLGGGALDGNLGLNSDFSTLTIPLGRVVQSVDNEGYIQYWIIEETLKAGGNALANGLYANRTTLKEVAGGVSKLSVQSRQAIEATYKAQGYNNVFFFEDGFTYTESNDVGIYEDGTAWTYAGALPVTVAAGTVPSEGVYEPAFTNDHNNLANRNAAGAHDDIYKRTYANTDELQANADSAVSVTGQKFSTGLTTWLVTSKPIGLEISNTTPTLYAKPLNGVFIDDCGAVGDALFYVSGAWYVDQAGTMPATNNTQAFSTAINATGGTDSKGTINFGYGGYLISPETIDADGIDIRQKTIRGKGPENTTIVQSGLNTYQTLFRNNPRNLSEAGLWGSGGTFNIFDIYIRGNWDGSSDQTVIPPESGKGNGLTGILKNEYDFDTQGGVVQLISASRAFIQNVWVSHGYGHNVKYYRHGYGRFVNSRSFATRGSGCWIDCPSASDAFTSTPIIDVKFESCRGQYGGLYVNHMWGSSVTDCLFEGQPYGFYLEEGGDVDTSGNYFEAHYFDEEFYIDSKCWGITDQSNYSFNQTDPRLKDYKGLFHYRRDSGLHVKTDSAVYGTRPADINGHYMQRDAYGFGVQPASFGVSGVSMHVRKSVVAGSGAGSLGGYTAIRHESSATSGAAEIRFKRNLSNDNRSGIGFATTLNGADIIERWTIDANGNMLATVDSSVSVGGPTNRVLNIFANLPTFSDDSSAGTGGMVAGQMYKTATGEVRIKL